VSQTYTFAFIDLAGFTALTDAHGDQTAADYVARFVTLARDSLAGSTCLVNVIGDAVLLAADTVDDGLASTLALLGACNGEPAFPLARAGIHTGTAVLTGDNYLGAGVNVAARITARAAGGELVLTLQPAAAARVRGLHVHDMGLVTLRNITHDVELHRIDLYSGQRAVDPVCRMTVARHDAAGTLTYNSHDYWFCSLDCAGTFAADPSRHTVPPASDTGPVRP
jgi:adenylate cyclase